METNKPAPSDINNLLILTRDLKNSVSNEFAGFANLEIMTNVGVPKIGDVVKTIRGEPHLMTKFGKFKSALGQASNMDLCKAICGSFCKKYTKVYMGTVQGERKIRPPNLPLLDHYPSNF